MIFLGIQLRNGIQFRKSAVDTAPDKSRFDNLTEHVFMLTFPAADHRGKKHDPDVGRKC